MSSCESAIVDHVGLLPLAKNAIHSPCLGHIKNYLFIIRKIFFNGEGGHFLFLFFIFKKSWFFKPLPRLRLSGIRLGLRSHHPKPKSPKTSANDVASAHTTILHQFERTTTAMVVVLDALCPAFAHAYKWEDGRKNPHGRG